MTIKIIVHFEGREDGGLKAYSDDLAGFVLSHSDPNAVLKDVKPALERILSCLFKEPVVLEVLSLQDHQLIPRERVFLTHAA
jgi:hypothetical protein